MTVLKQTPKNTNPNRPLDMKLKSKLDVKLMLELNESIRLNNPIRTDLRLNNHFGKNKLLCTNVRLKKMLPD